MINDYDAELENIGLANIGSASPDMLQKWQLHLDNELEGFRRSLLGIIKNPNFDGETDTNLFYHVVGTEKVNEAGANAIYNKFYNYLTKMTSSSKLDETLIKRELYFADLTFSNWLARNMNKFNLSSKDFTDIVETFLFMLQMALYRSHKGWLGDRINAHPTTREIVYRASDETERRGNKIFDNLPFVGGKK